MLSTPANPTQPATTGWEWVDSYYADYEAMSAAPVGAAMERWLARYAPFALFEDPTLGISAMGRDSIRKPYVEAFTGRMGSIRWTILRRVRSNEWIAVEGWLSGSQDAKPFRTRFTTWLKVHDGQIIHQIDYVDYSSLRKQLAGTMPVPAAVTPSPVARRGAPSAAVDRAFRVADEFYRRVETIPHGEQRVTPFLDLLTEDYVLENPQMALRYEGREDIRSMLRGMLRRAEYGPVVWDISRRATDGEWVAVEGTWRGTINGRPFGTRFTTWIEIREERAAGQIDYLDYRTLEQQTGLR